MSSMWHWMSHDHNWANGSWNSLWYMSALDDKHVSGVNYARKPKYYCLLFSRSVKFTSMMLVTSTPINTLYFMFLISFEQFWLACSIRPRISMSAHHLTFTPSQILPRLHSDLLLILISRPQISSSHLYKHPNLTHPLEHNSRVIPHIFWP